MKTCASLLSIAGITDAVPPYCTVCEPVAGIRSGLLPGGHERFLGAGGRRGGTSLDMQPNFICVIIQWAMKTCARYYMKDMNGFSALEDVMVVHH